MSKAQVDEIVNKDDTGPVDFPQGLTQNGGAPVGGSTSLVPKTVIEKTYTVDFTGTSDATTRIDTLDPIPAGAMILEALITTDIAVTGTTVDPQFFRINGTGTAVGEFQYSSLGTIVDTSTTLGAWAYIVHDPSTSIAVGATGISMYTGFGPATAGTLSFIVRYIELP